MNLLWNKYARLLVDYCLEIKRGDKLYIDSTTLAEPLIREVYRTALSRGAWVEVDMHFSGKNHIFYKEAGDEVLNTVSPFRKMALETFDAYLNIRAPFNLREDSGNDSEKMQRRKRATKPLVDTYFERTANRSLKRTLCQFPTQAAAQEAGMSLEEYTEFIVRACKLDMEDPVEGWLEVRKMQSGIVQHLNQVSDMRYKGPDFDVSFSVEDRTWINSDGRTNMPSGEVFSAPVEDSVNGKIRFSYPAIYMGHEVRDVTLWVENGFVEKWEASAGKEFLDKIFEIEGTRRFGEVAIGTNYDIQRVTKNILFDEKIGGSIHMAIGQAYKQCGGKNQSTVHWDFITDMRDGGEIWADNEKIYESGKFLI